MTGLCMQPEKKNNAILPIKEIFKMDGIFMFFYLSKLFYYYNNTLNMMNKKTTLYIQQGGFFSNME